MADHWHCHLTPVPVGWPSCRAMIIWWSFMGYLCWLWTFQDFWTFWGTCFWVPDFIRSNIPLNTSFLNQCNESSRHEYASFTRCIRKKGFLGILGVSKNCGRSQTTPIIRCSTGWSLLRSKVTKWITFSPKRFPLHPNLERDDSLFQFISSYETFIYIYLHLFTMWCSRRFIISPTFLAVPQLCQCRQDLQSSCGRLIRVAGPAGTGGTGRRPKRNTKRSP